MTASSFSPRMCPHCRSDSRRTLLLMDRDTIFRSNWSYRADAVALLSVDGSARFPIDQCIDCGFVYAGQMPDPAFLATVYDRVIEAAAARASNLSVANMAAKMTALAPLLSLLGDASATQRVLDFGCGFGPMLQLLCAVPSVRALGYETSGARLDDLLARKLPATGSMEVVVREGPFNAVILDNVLEHVPSPRETLALIGATTTTDTVIYVSVPQATAEKIAASQRAVDNADTVAMDINPWEHLNYFDLPHLDSLFAEIGFRACTSAQLASPVDIGIRPQAELPGRLKNSVASLPRLARYVMRGDVMASVIGRYYRKAA